MKAIQRLQTLHFIVFGLVILYFGRSFFVPLCFAVLISFVLYPVCLWLEKHKLSRGMAITVSLLALMLFFSLLIFLLGTQLSGFAHEWGNLQAKFEKALNDFSAFAINTLGISRDVQLHWLSQVLDQAVKNIFSSLQNAVTVSANSAVMLIIIPVYVVLILYYRHQWVEVIYRLFPDEKKKRIRHILYLSISTYYNFIKGMAIVYFMVGVLNSIGLLALGIPQAIFFGFVASILTFIPYVGIIIGSLLPIAMAWITYDSVWYPLGVVAVFVVVQYIEANLIFPFAVSHKLNVNPLAVLFSIFLGGILWGVAGMILFVPFVGILKLIADRSPKLKTLSIFLGDNSL